MITALDLASLARGGALPMLLLVLTSTLVLLAAMGIAAVLRRAAAGVRHVVWLAALGALLALPVLEAWSPWRPTILPGRRR